MTNENRSILQEIESLARGNNNRITYKDVMSIIESNDVDPEVAEKIFDSIEAKGIEILPETNVEEENLSEVDLNSGFGEGIGLDDPVRMYLKEIGKVPLLNAEQEQDLAQRMLAGDQEAKDMLIEANLRQSSAPPCRPWHRYRGKPAPFARPPP